MYYYISSLFPASKSQTPTLLFFGLSLSLCLRLVFLSTELLGDTVKLLQQGFDLLRLRRQLGHLLAMIRGQVSCYELRGCSYRQ